MGRGHHGAHPLLVIVPVLRLCQISGGTGITPFCQLIHKELLSQPSPNSKTRFTLLHSSRRPTELPPSEMLKPLIDYSQAHPDKLRLSLFVDAPDGSSHPAVPSSSLTVGRIGKAAIERATGSEKRTWWQRVLGLGASTETRVQDSGRGKVMFLVCGPDPYVTHEYIHENARLLMVRLPSP